MSYEKTKWVDGDVVTALRLNKIEEGIEQASLFSSSGGGFVVSDYYDGPRIILDKPAHEIIEAIESGRVPYYVPTTEGCYPQMFWAFTNADSDYYLDFGSIRFRYSSSEDVFYREILN